MKMNELFPSNYLKKEDIPAPVQVTIRQVIQEEIQGDGGKELKAVIAFNHPGLKPMILNRGNAEALCAAYGDDSTAWHGKQVEIYVDAGVMFAGRRVGGLRLRIPSDLNGVFSAPGHSVGPAVGPAGQLWDVSDGQTVKGSLTTAQVNTMLVSSGIPFAQIKIRRAGNPASTLPANQWPEFAGLEPAPAGSGRDDPIPF